MTELKKNSSVKSEASNAEVDAEEGAVQEIPSPLTVLVKKISAKINVEEDASGIDDTILAAAPQLGSVQYAKLRIFQLI